MQFLEHLVNGGNEKDRIWNNDTSLNHGIYSICADLGAGSGVTSFDCSIAVDMLFPSVHYCPSDQIAKIKYDGFVGFRIPIGEMTVL